MSCFVFTVVLLTGLCFIQMISHGIHIGMADSDVKSATFSSVPELKKIISTDKAPAAIGPYSQATVVGKTAYVSGCIAIIPGSSPPTLAEGGIEGQTRQLLDNMKAVVEACGGTMANVCKTTIFLHGDMSNCALRVSSNTQAAKCSVVHPLCALPHCASSHHEQDLRGVLPNRPSGEVHNCSRRSPSGCID